MAGNSAWTHVVRILTPDRHAGNQGAVPVPGERGLYQISFYGYQAGDTIRAVGDIDTDPGQVLARPRLDGSWACAIGHHHERCAVLTRPARPAEEQPRPHRLLAYILRLDTGDVVPMLGDVGSSGLPENIRLTSWEELRASGTIKSTRDMPYRRVHPPDKSPAKEKKS